MAFDYEQTAALALKQITDKGKSCTLSFSVEGSHDIDTDTFVAGTPTTETAKYVRKDFKQSEIDGTIVQQDDFKALIAASDLTTKPATDDFLIDGTRKYKIQNVKTLAPAAVDILYTLHLTFFGEVS